MLGERGATGPPGSPGPMGGRLIEVNWFNLKNHIVYTKLEKGFDGPRGPKGDAGKDGSPGAHGTCLHSCEGFKNAENIRMDVLFFNMAPRIPSSIFNWKAIKYLN